MIGVIHMTTSTKKALTAAQANMANKAAEGRAGVADVAAVAYAGLTDADLDWDDARRERGLTALVRMICCTFARKDGKRAIMADKKAGLPKEVGAMIAQRDKDYDKAKAQAAAAKAEKAAKVQRKLKRPTSQEVQAAAQGNHEADDTTPPKPEAVAKVKSIMRLARKQGIVEQTAAR